MLNNINGKPPFSLYTYKGRVLVYKIISRGIALYENNPPAIDWLRLSASTCSLMLNENDLISSTDKGLLSDSVEGIIADMVKNKVDINNLSVEELGMFANTENNLKLLTMHKAKGREFDAVAIIDLHEGKVPFYKDVQDNNVKGIEESKRLLYVSITRAKHFLMYITDQEHPRNTPSRFLTADYLNLQIYNKG